MVIPVKMQNDSYNIYLERGSLNKVSDYVKASDRKVLIVTDSGVPGVYVETVKKQFNNAVIFTFPQGEESKNFYTFKSICQKLLAEGFSRKDCVIAVGGGVVGDMTGFAASCYMRGIDFYNIPTTLLSQVDSSIGGKTAIDLDGIKNIIGAFYQPKAVIIDPDVLLTLPVRHISNGIAESIKMGITSSPELFSLCEDENYINNIDKIIELSLLVKRTVVEEDEKEIGLRKVLNFGHTIGHGIESSVGLSKLFHGECVSLGMLPMCTDNIKDRVKKVLKNCGLPTEYRYNKDDVYSALTHDKKTNSKGVTLVKSKEIGSFYFEDTPISDLMKYL